MADQLSQTFAALADPTRREMLSILSHGQATVSEIAEPFLKRMSMPAVTKHLKVLERAGLVTKTQDAQRRLCNLNPSGFQESVQFMEQYRQMMEESLDRFGAYLETLTKQSTKTKRKSKTRSSNKHGRKK
ncbi:MAG: metalloregulator ArsR/SmtB family transcription factor [Pirellulaceae bacterium]